MISWRETVLAEYNGDPVMLALFDAWNASIDPFEEINNFYDNVVNLATANDYGLDVWGRIVGVGRVIKLASQRYLGFAQQTTLTVDPFNVSPFYSGQVLTSNYSLDTEGYRKLIYAKALANISDGSVPSINRVLMTLFKARGNAYVTDNGDMTMTYVFTFALTHVEQAIVTQSGVLPKTSAVRILIQEVT